LHKLRSYAGAGRAQATSSSESPLTTWRAIQHSTAGTPGASNHGVGDRREYFLKSWVAVSYRSPITFVSRGRSKDEAVKPTHESLGGVYEST
jgi:hypothetical protein